MPHYRDECRRRHVLIGGNLPDVVNRLRNVELKVMTWNLADFSTSGVAQSKLWSKATDSSSEPDGRLTLVANTIAEEAPDVVFIQEVKPGDGGEKAVEQLTNKLNILMKDREPDVWVGGDQKRVVNPPDVRLGREDENGNPTPSISYDSMVSGKLKQSGAGAETYGCLWNVQKLVGEPVVKLLNDAGKGLDEIQTALGAKKGHDEVKQHFLSLGELSSTFSRYPALFTFKPKYGGWKVDPRPPEVDDKKKSNPDEPPLEIHFLVFHLASSNPQCGGKKKNTAEMKVLQSLAKHAWKAGSRLILLGDHNAAECGTTKVLYHGFNESGGRFVVPTTTSTNLFPFMKGAGKEIAVEDKCDDYLQFLEENGVSLRTSNVDGPVMHGEVQLTYANGELVIQNGLKEALKQIIADEGLSDTLDSLTKLSGKKSNDNIIFPQNTMPRGRVRAFLPRWVKATFVRGLHFLEARVLEVPAQKLLEYTIKHKEPFGSWKYLWSDHRPVVARFSLS